MKPLLRKITTTPRDYEDYELTDMYMKLVENEIYTKPDLYLWSHRRWKHRDKTPQPK